MKQEVSEIVRWLPSRCSRSAISVRCGRCRPTRPTVNTEGESSGTATRPKAIGYIRVSTNRQAENGYGLDAQRDQIPRYCESNGLDLVALIPDVMSGKRTDKLYGRIAAITAIRTGMANVLVVNTLRPLISQHGRRREAGCRREG